MTAALAALDVNPCRMCMPMGVVEAAYGVQGNMAVLHGSQGCATYIRRHMATHYNEPIDVASSALTEQGTVYGGAGNLMKALDNFIALYEPAAITVATTCLAETIGEDAAAILSAWREQHPDDRTRLIPVSSPGYGGSQTEGHFRFLRSVLEAVESDATAHDGINVIVGPMSPADVRALKDILASLGVAATILPDCSESLDGVRAPEYSRVHQGGTPLDAIARMAGARHTLELAAFVRPELSVAEYLHDAYRVPYTRLNVPVGLRDTDAFIDALRPFVSKPEGLEALAQARGRFLDAMIDSHKHNALGRAAVFGEPDFVASVSRMCLEQGVVPVLVASAVACKALEAQLLPEIEALAQAMLAGPVRVIDDADFAQIESLATELGVNVLIGSSDARRIAARHGIPLVRAAFPVHDHIGGQRIRTLGYDGAQMLIDRVTNALIDQTEGGFRESLKERYWKPGAPANTPPQAILRRA
jgi:nitrogenase molybdenum-iron protein alpha/beta subunit